MEKQRFYTIEEIIECFKADSLIGDVTDLYAKQAGPVSIGIEYWLDEPVDADDANHEVYPPEVITRQLRFIYSGQLFADVIEVTVEQKPNADLQDFVNALNYYNEHDTFMES